MRFKSHSYTKDILFVAAVFVAYLGFTDQLNLYIHPRYIGFTLTMACIALVLMLSGTKINHHAHGSSLINIPLLLVIAFALLLPARTLSSATVSQRATDAGSIVTSAESRPLDSLFAGSSRGLRMADWSRILGSNQDPGYYENKPAEISGFIYDAELGTDTVWLARFIVTCCAVDAQPVGVPVRIENWKSEFKSDEWVEVEGTFQLLETVDGQSEMVLMPNTIKKIEQPGNPYAN